MGHQKLFRISLLALLVIYVTGAFLHAILVNKDIHSVDQSAYLNYAKMMKKTNYDYVGDRNRMPVYPFLLSLLYHDDLNDGDFFLRGKLFNIILSIIILFALFLASKLFLGAFESWLYVLLAAFTIFVYKAGYVQCELLYYFLSFCTFLFLWSCLKVPRLWMGICGGLLAGITYLTKASILPALFLFIFFYVIMHIIIEILARVGVIAPLIRAHGQGHLVKKIVILMVFIGTFLAVLSPYITTNKKIFGRYFYNVNTTFYVWYDSWQEVEKGTKAHGDRVGWPNMPAEEIPSFRKYLKDHNFGQILGRFCRGLLTVGVNNIFGGGYLKLFFIYLAMSLMILYNQCEDVKVFLKDRNNRMIIAFMICYFAGYFMLYAFYSPINAGNRLVLFLYLPALFMIFVFLSRYPLFTLNIRNTTITVRDIHWLIIILLSIDIIFFVPFKLQFDSGA